MDVRHQLDILRGPPRFVRLIRPCIIGDGIVRMTDAQKSACRALYDEMRPGLTARSFIPASGAASRMFSKLAAGDSGAIRRFAENADKFAFFEDITAAARRLGLDDSPAGIVRAALIPEGLRYGSIPKGLVKFHRYGDICADAFDEHIRTARLYSDDVHFTVSASFPDKEKKRLASGGGVSFSVQAPDTNTVALNEEDEMIRDGSGNPVFRPSGHGALLANLHSVDGDIIFISNIDNVSRREAKPSPDLHRKELAGLLLERVRESGPSRPMRVCGMIRNTGAPGGGPFWVEDSERRVSPQIVESAQVDHSNPSQERIWQSATHFNPVDLVCMKGGFDLNNYTDGVFMVVNKTLNGRPIRALEMPGLWNGAMAGWETVFVEIPSSSFNPVKEVFDLLLPCHQDLDNGC